MTTVLFTRGMVCSDSRMSGDMVVASDKFKKLMSNDRYIVGYSGQAGQAQRLARWVLSGMVDGEGNDTLPPLLQDEALDCEVVFVNLDTGKLYTISGEAGDLLEIDYPFAIGSGGHIALGAYNMQKAFDMDDPIKAVEIAIELDLYSGGKVQSIPFIIDK